MIKSLQDFKLYYEDLPEYSDTRARIKIIRLKRALKRRGGK